MCLSSKQVFVHSLAALLLSSIVVVPVSAQSPSNQGAQSPPQLEVTVDPDAQIPRAPLPAQVPEPYWASIGGFEADTHGTGYGFFGPQYIHPLGDNVSFIGNANINYLYYEYDNGAGGLVDVNSPGVSLMGGVMFGRRNWVALQAGPSFKRRHTEILDTSGNLISSSRDTDIGVNLAASTWYDPTSHNNISAMVNYDTVDQYTWGRVAFKEQVANRSWQGDFTPYLGVEFIGQGNDDIQSRQFGGFVEIAHAPSAVSIMLRAGVKRSSFEFGPDKTGPWFAIGFYHRVR
jgi:hypothetical protein